MKMIRLGRRGIKNRWVGAFLALSVIPILLVNIFYYYNTSAEVEQRPIKIFLTVFPNNAMISEYAAW